MYSCFFLMLWLQDTILKQKSMEIEMSKCMKESKDEQTSKKRKRKKVDRFVFLPDDILLDILKRVPDCFLRYKAKYVCRRWFNIITNKILLDHASFILQKTGTITVRVVDIREEEGQGLQVKEQDLDIPHKGIIRSWCNEFFLIWGSSRNTLYVYNVITKEGLYLPKCNVPCGGYYTNRCGVALSFDRFKGGVYVRDISS
ncbi:hypothetical protein L2E82_01232 [Cichorium intybus]|uniref:Uncharacterized protein n=1 Tax=Cichorium intybus TaxID=13427 RepID=A0ACB9GYE4_CICIN|nr:hypothetical protein L2E82_01232 [Cichorium intybus]